MFVETPRQITVHAPCVNAQFNLQFLPSIFMHDIIREVENQVIQHPDYLLGTPLEEFSLFETDDKIVLNSLPPVIPTFNLSAYPQVIIFNFFFIFFFFHFQFFKKNGNLEK